MKYLGLIFIFTALTYLQALALETILNTYEDIDYNHINVYEIDDPRSCYE